MANALTLISETVLSSPASSVSPLHELHSLPHRHYIIDTLVTDEGCWILQDRRTAKNYTVFVIEGKRQVAHRYMWEYTYGDIPEGLVVDHTCHNESVRRGECAGGDTCRHRPCFNPEHMRLTTPVDNYMQGAAGYWSKKACPKGHERNMENTMYVKSSRNANILPSCRLCHNERSLRSYFRSMGKGRDA